MMRACQLALTVAAVLAVPAHAVQFDNRSFEQGNLNGWDYVGDASAQETAALGVTPLHGQHAALLTNSKLWGPGYYGSTAGTDSLNFLEWLGLSHLTPPLVPPFPADWLAFSEWTNNTGNVVAQVDGHSGLRQSVELRAGDVVSFAWNQFGDGAFDQPFALFYPTGGPFWGGEYVNLSAPFVYPNTMNPWLGDCVVPSVLPYDPNCVFATGWQSYSFVAPSDGDYTLAFGIFNRLDEGWLSALWVDDFKVSRVPEPDVLSLVGLGLAGLAFARRKRARSIFAAAIAALLVLGAGVADASIIYDWTGTCTLNCSGTAKATMYLDDSYVPGSTIPEGATNLILRLDVFMPTDGQYPSYGFTFFDFFVWYQGVTLPEQSGPGLVNFSPLPATYDANFFSTAPDGRWQFGEATWIESGGIFLTCWTEGSNCAGTSSLWMRRVPEPASIALLGLGLAGLVITRRRKK